MKPIWLVLLLFFSSCDLFFSSKDKVAYFEKKTLRHLFESTGLNIERPDYINSNKSIIRPYLTTQKIFSSSHKLKKYSIEYKTPKRDKRNGILSLIDDKENLILSELHNVYDLKMYFNESSKIMKINNYKLNAFELYFDFKIENKNFLFSVPFFNITRNNILKKNTSYLESNNYSFKKFSSSKKLTRMKGVLLFSNENIVEESLIGKFSDSYLDKKVDFCYRVDKYCRPITTNTCDKCRFGFYPIVDYYCPQGGGRICGVNRCGEKNMPACPIGEVASKMSKSIKDLCFDGSTAGFCRPGLQTVCDGRKVLICL